ncbi:MAG: winged helix-turn-helix domain-containing protein [Candidatus Omnitrophica bacterium]|nr:winged helix-turn-helix domain-containing protein [Candidatus Omnitrophota bacterium]
MIMEIGIVAGDIWHYLDENGDSDLENLISGINKPRNLVLMGLGWLAREGHVSVGNEHEKTCQISLREKKG